MLALFTKQNDHDRSELPLYLHNTLSGHKEKFEPLKDDHVRLYTCGPTVYDYAHIGNLRAYVFSDLLRRTLRFNGYKVKHVMNATDVGHLTSDADVGEDKMALAVKRAGKPMTLEGMHEVADEYIAAFKEDLEALTIMPPHVMPRPSEHIPEQIALIQALIEKEYAYETSRGVYFDIKRFKKYGKLGQLDLEGMREGARVEEFAEKRNAGDFVLWRRGENIGWESPWGIGFPGWHIECSAMAMKHLGKQIDIHTGGVDHIAIHHNNEIAQSEAATGKPFARYWLHNAFLNIDETKISKSIGNTIGLRQLTDRGFRPLAYRYWLLTGHYRSPMNFTWEALEAAQQALLRLQRYFVEELLEAPGGAVHADYARRFHEAINDDLDTPKATALVWELVKDEGIALGEKRATLLRFDKVLALGLSQDAEKLRDALPEKTIDLKELPEDARLLVIAREEMREEQNWQRADELRDELKERGYTVEDTAEGPRVRRAG